MTVYVIGLAAPKSDLAWAEEYLPATEQLVKKHGGKYLARTDQPVRFEGDGGAHSFAIIIEFPSKEHTEAWLNDPEYAPLKALRLANAYCDSLLLDAL